MMLNFPRMPDSLPPAHLTNLSAFGMAKPAVSFVPYVAMFRPFTSWPGRQTVVCLSADLQILP